MIYFIKFPSLPLVKIGKADDVKRRIGSLQTSCPFKLELIHECEGDYESEQELHKHLRPARVRGEWFNMEHPLVQDAIEFIKSGRTAQQFLIKLWLADYRKRVAAIEEHNRKVRLINLINRLKASQNKSNSQTAQPVHA